MKLTEATTPPHIAKILDKYRDPGQELSNQEAELLDDYIKTSGRKDIKFKRHPKKMKDAEYELSSPLPEHPKSWKNWDTPSTIV